MLTADNFADKINQAIAHIQYPAIPAGLYQPIKYTLEGGGKRLRPLLLLATCDAVSGNCDRAINQAIAIEIFHNFTLLHDDVMDNADIRRGRPTVHRRWNNNTAILSGDAMLTMATQYLAKDAGDKLETILDIFNTTAMEIYEGQQFDVDFESTRSVSVDEYIMMIKLKTSVLLGCACKIGAIMGNAPEQLASMLYDYGIKLGLAFQLRDDYLDAYGDPLTFGKEIGGDIVNNKKTWLLITALNEDRTGRLEKALDPSVSRGEKIAKVKEVFEDLDLPRRCVELINKYASDAVEIIRESPLNADAKDFFTNIALSSIERTH
ncbi:MAG: polyprenyl synthetase family protein [Muribaculaceae bacterium]|nr:polyprenyl synthetase family protein [Muribaculaceae bacterium]MDE7369965.1 polyprenyl synthetase family protein [Muribaculaceae bacterium]